MLSHDVPRETIHELVGAYPFALFGQAYRCGKPAEQSFWPRIVRANLAEVKVTIALGEPSAVRRDQEGHVGIRGLRKAQQSLEVYLSRYRPQEVIAAHDLVDAHKGVVNHHGKLIRNHSVASTNEKVAALTREILCVFAAYEVAELDGANGVARVGHAQARRRGTAC